MNTVNFSFLTNLSRRTKTVAFIVILLLAVLLGEVFTIASPAIRVAVQAGNRQTHRQPLAALNALPYSFVQWQTPEVLSTLEANGLDMEVLPGGKKNDELGMIEPAQVIRFRTHAGDEVAEGIIFSFYSEDDLIKMENYYRGLNQALPMFKSWIFVQDNVLLQINGNLSEAQARQFEQALSELGY